MRASFLRPLGGGWFPALFGHEFRVLRQNRTACFVLVMLLAVAGLLRANEGRADAGPRVRCYIVYWEESDWVQALRESAARQGPDGLAVEVAPVGRFTDDRGQIHYPPGAHSIQLRPQPPGPDGRPRWLIWYWYSGSDPGALWPYARWFWQVTRDHFGGGPAVEERVSPLTLTLAVPGGRSSALAEPARLRFGLLWLGLFLTAGYLPLLSLSQDWERQTILSIALTRAGWRGLVLAKAAFALALALPVVVLLAGILRPGLLLILWFWLALLAGAAGYFGLALTVASLSRSVAAASAGLLAYGLASGGLVYASFQLEYAAPAAAALRVLSLEWSLFAVLARLGEAADQPAAALAALVALAGLWVLLGGLCYRRAYRR
jgi:hypothetical protein